MDTEFCSTSLIYIYNICHFVDMHTEPLYHFAHSSRKQTLQCYSIEWYPSLYLSFYKYCIPSGKRYLEGKCTKCTLNSNTVITAYFVSTSRCCKSCLLRSYFLGCLPNPFSKRNKFLQVQHHKKEIVEPLWF